MTSANIYLRIIDLRSHRTLQNGFLMMQNVKLFQNNFEGTDSPGFPRGGGANPQGGGANLLFGQTFPENCMKMKEFGSTGGHPLLDPPMTCNASMVRSFSNLA